MAKGIIGEPFTFTVLFLGDDGEPFTPNPEPTIEVFYFDVGGTKQSIAAAGTAMSAVGGDDGRWAYTVTIPAELSPANQVYGVMVGTDPISGLDITVEQEVDPFDQGSGQIEILDEGVSLGLFSVVNFVGGDVEVLTVDGVPTIYIPPLPPPPDPTYASHWDTADGDTGNQTVSRSPSNGSLFVSVPSGGEGFPYKTGGWGGFSNPVYPRVLGVTREKSTYTTSSVVTGFGGDSTVEIKVTDPDGSLEEYTTPTITGNVTLISPSGHIEATISSYGVDDPNYPEKQSAKLTVIVHHADILEAAGFDGGRFGVEIVHNVDSVSDGTGSYSYVSADIFYDSALTGLGQADAIELTDPPTITETVGNVVTKNLSGITYYDKNSQFTIAASDFNNLNRNNYSGSGARIFGAEYGLPQVNFTARLGHLIGWTNVHDVSGVSLLKTNWAINANNFRTVTNTANVTASPWNTYQGGGGFLKSSSNTSILVDTYGSSSTVTAEYFIDENRRQNSGYNANDPNGNWDSSQPLQVGEAMVFKGQLISPDEADFVDWTGFSPSGNPDYTGLTIPVSYFRTFVDGAGSSRSSMSVSLSGTFVGGNALADLGSENLKIFIRRRASSAGGAAGAAAAPLRLHGSLYNFAFFDDGQSDIGAGIREATSNGNTINATFGGFSCETGILMEIQITNTNVKLNSVIVTFI